MLSHTLIPGLRHCVTLNKSQTLWEAPFPAYQVRIITLSQIGLNSANAS